VLAVCMTVSRAGLWLYDNVVQQIIVEGVNASCQNSFNAYCNSLNNMFFMAINILTLVFNNSENFP